MTAGQLRTSTQAVEPIVAWYFRSVYGSVEGPGVVPFYCDSTRVGHFAVNRTDLALGEPTALFRLFVMLAMYQGRRDTLLMAQQQGMSRASALSLTSSIALEQRIARSTCGWLRPGADFERGCCVRKSPTGADCDEHPAVRCHVKVATDTLKRMGDMGKLPTSAWLVLGKRGALSRMVAEVRSESADARERAALAVDRLSVVWRVGRKLATLFVSVLSTPALAPGLTPWHPEFDGNDLVVVDTNVKRVVEAIGGSDSPGTYEAHAEWIRGVAARIDLRRFAQAPVPTYSPRLVQQAMYHYGSKSNRLSRNDSCAGLTNPCPDCVAIACPFQVKRRTPTGAERRA